MKKVNGKSYLLIGLSLIFIGILTLIGSVELFKNVATLAMILIILITIKDLFSLIIKKPKLDIKLFIRIINVILAILAYIFNEYSIAIVPIIFAIYALLNSLGYFINFGIVKINKESGGFKYFMRGLICLILGVTLLFRPLLHLDIMLSVIGIYSLLLGISFISDYLEVNNYRKLFQFRISLPTIIEAFIPISVLQKINKTVNDNDEIKVDKNKKDEQTDLEIFIHVTENGYGQLGHMDMCFENEIISFGNYDKNTYKFYDLIGTGVLFSTTNIDKYIKFCIEDNKKTLFSFGIKLNNKEKKQIKENINKLKSQLKEWEPPYLKAKNEKKRVKKEDYIDYSSRLYRATKAKFYKFKLSNYRIYFILGSNCVTLINKILGKILKSKLRFYGFMTPGTYYDYLEREYLKKNSIVVSKKIYSKETIK